MKFFFSLLIICFCRTGISQNIPWFLNAPVFKEWVIQNEVRCLKYETPVPVGEEIKRYGYYESFDSKAPEYRYEITDYSIDRIVHEFYFDKAGLLDSFASKVLTIQFVVNDSSYQYPSAILQAGSIPRKSSQFDQNKLSPYQSKTVLKDFKTIFMECFIGPDGTVWYDSFHSSRLLEPKDKYIYRLLQTVDFENGKPVEALNVLYTGDSWTAFYQQAKIEMIGDSLEVLRRHQTVHNPDTFEEYCKLNDKDSVFVEDNYYKINPKTGLKEYRQKINGKFQTSWSIREKSTASGRIVYYENFPFYADFQSFFNPGCELLQFSNKPDSYPYGPDLPGFYSLDWQNGRPGNNLELVEKMRGGKVTQSKVYKIYQNKKILVYEDVKTANGVKRLSGSNNKWFHDEIDFQLIDNELRVLYSQRNNHINRTDTTLWLWTNGDQLNYIDFLDKHDPVYRLQIVKW